MRSFKISVVKVLTLLVAMLMFGTSTFAQVSVALPNISGVVGSTGTGAITVGDLTGKNVTAFQFTLYYDKNVMEISGATPGTLLGESVPTVNADIANGKISVAWASATALTGQGTLVNLQIAYKANGSSALNFGSPSTFKFNAGNPAAIVTDGSVVVPAIILTAGTVSVRSGQAVRIPVTVSAITDAQNVRSYEFVCSYDKSIINITSVEKDGTLSTDGSVSVNPAFSTNSVKVAWASANRVITTGGTLLYLVGTTVATGTTTLSLSAVKVNAGTPLAGGNAGQVTVTAANVAPTLTLAPVGPAYTIDALKELKITLTGNDSNPEDVASLVYAVSGNPTGSTLTNKIFTWTPTLAQRQAAAYSFEFSVTDQLGAVTKVPVTVTVTANAAPTLTLDPVGPSYTIGDGVAFKITLTGSDANAEDVASLIYTTSKLPGTATFKDKVFTWTPTVADRSATPYTVTFTVADQAGLKTDVVASITVSQNAAPTLTLNPSTAQTVNENQKVTITLVGADTNPSDVASLKYTITKPTTVPTGAAIAGNVFTWTPNYDQSSATAYAFEFTVTDQGGLTGKATVNITVVNVPRAPVFTKEPPYEVVPVVKVDPKWGLPKPYTFQYVATSPDGKSVIFSLIAGPAGASITSDGVFSWTPDWQTQVGKVYTVTVQASDGTLTTNSTQLLASSNTIVGVEQYSGVPTEYNLFQNYPNPFNPTTSIQVALPKDGNVKLTVYSILGEEVTVLANKYMPAGYHRFTFDASRLNSGMYLYRIEANGYVSVKKMLLVK